MSPVAGILEIIEQPLYDSLSIPFGFSTGDRAMMFTVPYGGRFHDPRDGAMRLKDLTETNMMQHGQLPAPQKFLVKAIRAALFGRRGELLPITSRYYRGAIFELVVFNKRYWTGPLWRVADPAVLFACGPVMLTSFDKDERADLIRALRCGLMNTEKDSGVLIEAQAPFHVEIKFDPSFEWERVDAPGSLVVLLEGSHAIATV